MIVLDASAAIDWLLQTAAGQEIEKRIYSRKDSVHAPHLLDLEVVQVMRRMAREGTITTSRAEEAVGDLLDLRITRYPHPLFVPWIWQHRSNLSTYEACYVPLAEHLGATLITRDHRLGSAAGHSAKIEVF